MPSVWFCREINILDNKTNQTLSTYKLKTFLCVRITITVAIIRETVRLHQQHEHDKEKASLHV